MVARRKEARTCGRDGASPEKSSPKIALDKKTAVYIYGFYGIKQNTDSSPQTGQPHKVGASVQL